MVVSRKLDRALNSITGWKYLEVMHCEVGKLLLRKSFDYRAFNNINKECICSVNCICLELISFNESFYYFFMLISF